MSVKMQALILVTGVLLVFICLLHNGSAQENTYEELVYWSKNENFDKNYHLELLSSKDTNSFSTTKSVSYWLYKREHPDIGHQLVPNDLTTLMSSDFDQNKPTKIIIHGWLGHAKSFESVCTALKVQYFTVNDYNIVCVDWTVFALDVSYFTARLRCRTIGRNVAEVISMLIENTSQTIDDIHILGFSMGAHIAGYAGKQLNGKIYRITGLDPAKPLFPIKWSNDRLNKNDAQFVDIVHTTKLVLGQSASIGNIDFYPNNDSTDQPGCWYGYIYGEVCSHYKAFQFYARSILSKDEFKSMKCDNVNDYKFSRCGSDEFTYLGEYANSNFSGTYYLSVL